MKKHFPDPEHELGLPRGWAIRPFSILASSFKTVVLADADTIFLRDPRILINETGFLGYGSLSGTIELSKRQQRIIIDR